MISIFLSKKKKKEKKSNTKPKLTAEVLSWAGHHEEKAGAPVASLRFPSFCQMGPLAPNLRVLLSCCSLLLCGTLCCPGDSDCQPVLAG